MPEITTNSAAETKKIAASFAQEINPGDIVLMTGELGSGKTTFVQGLAKALGITEQVASPTFTLVSEYPTNHKKIKKLIHADLYRLTKTETAEDNAIKETIEQNDANSLLVIEWADRLAQHTNKSTWHINFSHNQNKNSRHITITKPSSLA